MKYNFKVLMEYLTEQFAQVHTRLDAHEERFSQIANTMDGLAKTVTETRDEVKVIAARTSRMEGWIMKAAVKIGVRYEP